MYKRTIFGISPYTTRPKAPKFIVQPDEFNRRLLCKTTKNPLFRPFSPPFHTICRLAATSFASATSFAALGATKKLAPPGSDMLFPEWRD